MNDTDKERLMKTAYGLNDYCLKRIAGGEELAQTFYLLTEHGRTVTPVPWSSLPGEIQTLREAFINLLSQQDPDLVVQFIIVKFSQVAAITSNIEQLDSGGEIRAADPRLLMMNCLGRLGAFSHIQALDAVPGFLTVGDVFTGLSQPPELKELLDGLH